MTHSIEGHAAGAERLHAYWVHGEGAARIRWGTPGDFDRCTRQLEEHAHFTPEQAHGYCNLAHHAATGMYPAQHAAMEHGHRSAHMDRAQMTSQSVNDLPDSDFAYIEPGGTKDSEGKTTPRSLRHFPIHDAAHVRNALARASQSPFGAKAMPAIRAAAKKFGIDVSDTTSNRYLAPSAVYERYSATVTDVNTSQRIIDVIAVPWNQDTAEPVPFEDGMYRERFIPGAFDHLADSPGRIAVNTGHDRTALVGKVVGLEPRHSQGLRAALKIAKIPSGDDVLQLASEDMLAPSVGYYTRQGGYRKSRRLGTVEVRWAGLDHIALVGVPAYTGAVIDGIRQQAPPAAATLGVDAPLLTAFMNDPVVQWAQSRVTRGRV